MKKLTKVYLKAANLLETEKCNYCCDAIRLASVDFSKNPEYRCICARITINYFILVYSPTLEEFKTRKSETFMQERKESISKDGIELKNRRVLAMLMMAEMSERNLL